MKGDSSREYYDLKLNIATIKQDLEYQQTQHNFKIKEIGTNITQLQNLIAAKQDAKLFCKRKIKEYDEFMWRFAWESVKTEDRI